MSAVLKQSADWQADLSGELTTLPGASNQGLNTFRQARLDAFVELGFPSRKTEAWKYVSTYALTQCTAKLSSSKTIDSADLDQWRLDDTSASLVFINGVFHSALSQLPNNDALSIESLAELIEDNADTATDLFDSNDGNDAFDALNQALTRDGVVIRINDNAQLSQPLHCIYLSAGDEQSITPISNIIEVGKNAQCPIVESHVGNDDAAQLNLVRTNLKLDANSHVTYYRDQRESRASFHIAEMAVSQARDSHLRLHSIALGGAIARLNLRIKLAESGADCQLNGLYLSNDKQVTDHHVEMHHAVPHCHSDQLIKGVMDGQSKAVFNGRILVDIDAQKTEAYLTNRNLLLSKLADINTKPELEIYADDVKCSHGATIGQLDKKAIFYLQSRGVSREHAEHLLIYAFINDVINRIELESLRKQLSALIVGRLPDSEFIRGVI